MKVIVVRQPWAWLIVNGHKDIENRTWGTKYRGPLLIQASATRPTRAVWEERRQYAAKRGVTLPDEFDFGGIVGMVRLDDCVTKSRSKWFDGDVAWVLSRPRRLPFLPLNGRLGLYDPPRKILKHYNLSLRTPVEPKPRITSPQQLRRRIHGLKEHPPITTAFERSLSNRGAWDGENSWYSSQREHWLGWLREYEGPGFYDRAQWRRSAEFVYNHIVCPPMVLWLGEAAGVPKAKLERARRAALNAGQNLSAQSAAIRREIRWGDIEVLLTK